MNLLRFLISLMMCVAWGLICSYYFNIENNNVSSVPFAYFVLFLASWTVGKVIWQIVDYLFNHETS